MHGGDIYNNDVDIDFSVNLNPYHMMLCNASEKFLGGNAIAASLAAAVLEGLEGSDRYPDINQGAVRTAIAKADCVNADCVYAGCGASELLMASVRTRKPDRLMLAEPGFSGYRHAAGALSECAVLPYRLKEEDGFAVTDALADELSADIDMLILADPNNPTGKNIDEKALIRILDRADELGISVILDESFLMISDKYIKIKDTQESVHSRTADMIKRYESLFIIRSYTKSFALPGIRMGYVISRPENIRRIKKELPEWNLPALSEAMMRRCASISSDSDFYTKSVEMITGERNFLEEQLSDAGLKVFSGDSVFILFKGPEGLYEALLKDKILIRKCDDPGGPGGNFYRISVRSHEDNMLLVEALRKVIKK